MSPAPARRRWPRVLAAVVAVLILAAAVAVAVWVVRYPEADPDAVAAVLLDPLLDVEEADDGTWSVHPVTGPSDTAVVFYPGAGVPPEAYLPTWAPVVVDTGISVHIPPMPLRLAVLDRDRADEVVAEHPTVTTWWISGHSLGGAMAASYTDASDPGELAGLALLGAYAPSSADLSDRDELTVVSISGSQDGLSTPAEIADAAELLPPDTRFVELQGVNHAQFGAYGAQRGDGEPLVSDETARTAIADALSAVLGAPVGAGS